MRAAIRAAAFALALATPLVLGRLGAAPFDDPGEGMHAEIASELLLRGDPFALTLGGVRYVDKPPLLYAMVAASFARFGRTEWAARLPSALAGLAAIAVTAALGAALLRGAGGVLAGLALATSTGFLAYARYVRPETLLVAALASGFWLVILGLVKERRALVAVGTAIFGVAGLAKDPFAALAPPIAVGLAMLLVGRLRPLRCWLPPWGIAVGLVLAFGWWFVAGLRTPGFTWYTAVDNHLLNVMRARRFPDGDVPLGALDFLLVAALGAAPWFAAAVVTLWRLVRRRAWTDRSELPWMILGVWAVAVFGLTALSPFRLPHYGLPAYPAIAVLGARAWIERRGPALAWVHTLLFGVLAIACAVAWASDGMVFTANVMGAADVATRKSATAGEVSALPPWNELRPLLGVTAVIVAVGALTTAGVAARRTAWIPVVVTMLLVMPIVASALALVADHRAVRPIALEVTRRMGPDDLLVHEGPIEDSGALEWYAGRQPVIVDGRRSVLGFGATLPGAPAVFWEPGELTRVWSGNERVWVVTGREAGRSVMRLLPGARLVLAAGGRRLYVNRPLESAATPVGGTGSR